MDTARLFEIAKLSKTSAYNFRERRHADWTENYTLYRDKVVVNRLTQRQSVNVPLMKYSLQTVLKDIDDAPMLYFDNRDNDAQKEVFYNEYWKLRWRECKGTVKDIIDKKQNLHFGRTFKKLNIVNGAFNFEVIDPQDMLVDRYVDPASIDSARYVCQEHIFKPLSSLSENKAYDQNAINDLKMFFATEAGLIEASENAASLEEKNERMAQLGLIDAQSPVLGETYVELNEHYLKVWDEKEGKDVVMLLVSGDGQVPLYADRLDKVIGKTVDDYWTDHIPYTTWGSDPDRTDFWSDGIADIIRVPNKILNSWISQLVENRTLRNFGMMYFDSTITHDFVPQTFDPIAGGWYPVPGDPSKVMQRVDIPDLSDSIDEIKLIMDIAEKATAATSTQQGNTQGQKVTLGEVQLALQNAKERVKSMAVLYTDSWQEFGEKYIKLLEAAGDKIDAVRLYKKGNNTKHIYFKDLSHSDLESESGYSCEVRDLSGAASQTSDTLQKLNAAITVMPGNQPLNTIYKQKVLEFADLTATEVKEVIDAEKAALAPAPVIPGAVPLGTANPNVPVVNAPANIPATPMAPRA